MLLQCDWRKGLKRMCHNLLAKNNKQSDIEGGCEAVEGNENDISKGEIALQKVYSCVLEGV